MRDEPLERLVAPPARPGFHDELWERAAAAERAAARRWRRTSIALGAVAAAAIAAATALAATLGSPRNGVVDQTFSCATSLQGQRPTVWLWGNVRTKLSPVASLQVLPPGSSIAGGVWRLQTPLLSFAAAKDSFAVDPATCVPSHRRVPLAAAGLSANSPVTSTFIGNLRESCVVGDRARADRVLLHVRLELADGTPTRGELAVRNGATGKPVAYVIWTPGRILSFLSPKCSEIQ